MGPVAAQLLVVSMLAGAAGAVLRNAYDAAPLAGAEAGLLPSHLPDLEEELLGRHPERAAARFANAGYAVLTAVIALLLAATAWLERGVVVASLVGLVPALTRGARGGGLDARYARWTAW